MLKVRIYIGIALVSLIILLPACGQKNTVDKIYNHLEETVQLEKGFEDQQSHITNLEEKEKELYNEIIELGMQDFEKIVNLSNEAIDTINKRSEKIDLEKESIEASEEEFRKVEKLLSKLEDEEAKKKAQEMYDVMLQRYNAYDKIHRAYKTSLDLEKELYTMLQKEDVEQDALISQITRINESYKNVLEANKQFNEQTVLYNNLKKEFYVLVDVEVEFEGHSNLEN
ncbi:YkyA family protein [Virgibacillus sp. W0430]|uniref:YkyA family protein n=1 Tax=Virgibacillus sp. W0430 TaxID=3391580 RepID=UPI003F44EC75